MRTRTFYRALIGNRKAAGAILIELMLAVLLAFFHLVRKFLNGAVTINLLTHAGFWAYPIV